MENWKEIFKDTIPIGKYQTSVKNGEEAGFLIELESNEHTINIYFGVVSAFRMLDEGIVLNGIFDETEISKYRKNNFANTIYLIQNGEFSNFIKKIGNELYEYLDLKHFIIITINYVIEVISEWEPDIKVSKK